MKSNLYSKSRNYLATHQKIPLFLSHGGIHLIALIVLLIAIGILGFFISKMSKKGLVVIDTKIEFVNPKDNEKYPLRYFRMFIKNDSIKDESHINIDARFHDSNDYEKVKDLPISWSWEYTCPNTTLNYRNRGRLNLPKEYLKNFKYDIFDNGFRITFKDYYWFDVADLNTHGTLFGEDNLNPYYSTLIRFSQQNVNLDSLSHIIIDLSKSRKSTTVFSFENIYPQPSEVGLNKITYKGKEKVEEVIKNGGIFFEAKDIVKAYNADKLYLIFNILMGTMIAFCLEIIIKLIYKWRGITAEQEKKPNTIEQ